MTRNVYEETYQKYLEVISSSLHYLEMQDKVDVNTATAEELRSMAEDGYIVRYRNDRMFNAKVQMIVASLMTEFGNAMDDVIKERLPNVRSETDASK